MDAGRTIPPAVLALWSRLDAHDQDQFFAFVMRLRNGDAKAHRLSTRHAAGTISLRQLLDAMKPAKETPRHPRARE